MLGTSSISTHSKTLTLLSLLFPHSTLHTPTALFIIIISHYHYPTDQKTRAVEQLEDAAMSVRSLGNALTNLVNITLQVCVYVCMCVCMYVLFKSESKFKVLGGYYDD